MGYVTGHHGGVQGFQGRNVRSVTGHMQVSQAPHGTTLLEQWHDIEFLYHVLTCFSFFNTKHRCNMFFTSYPLFEQENTIGH